jgi:hypothetical protein
MVDAKRMGYAASHPKPQVVMQGRTTTQKGSKFPAKCTSARDGQYEHTAGDGKKRLGKF